MNNRHYPDPHAKARTKRAAKNAKARAKRATKPASSSEQLARLFKLYAKFKKRLKIEERGSIADVTADAAMITALRQIGAPQELLFPLMTAIVVRIMERYAPDGVSDLIFPEESGTESSSSTKRARSNKNEKGTHV